MLPPFTFMINSTINLMSESIINEKGENIILRTPKIPKNYSLDGTNDLRKKRTLDKDNTFIAHPSFKCNIAITSLKSTN